jgi:hypothetical protein
MTRSFLEEWLPFADTKGLQITMNNSQASPLSVFWIVVNLSDQDVVDTLSSTLQNMPNSPRSRSVSSLMVGRHREY